MNQTKESIKIYLDDERITPEGYKRCYWPNEVIALLITENVSEVSLDHDLGDDERGTGYDVLLWIEEQVFTNDYTPPIMKVHSSNSSAVNKMKLAIDNINNYVKNKDSKK